MNKYEEEIFAELFPTQLEVVNLKGQLEILDWDKSEYPLMFNDDGVPIAVIRLSNGSGAKIRFDVKPPRLKRFNYEQFRLCLSDSDFITLVKAARDGRSVENYLFSELFRYPFKIAHPDTGEITPFIVGSFSVHDISGIPVALMSVQNGGWTLVRFDYDPPQPYLLDERNDEPLDKAEFVELVKATCEKRYGTAVLHRQDR